MWLLTYHLLNCYKYMHKSTKRHYYALNICSFSDHPPSHVQYKDNSFSVTTAKPGHDILCMKLARNMKIA